MKKAKILFASAIPQRMERQFTLPAKFQRLLEKLPILKRVKGKTVAVKMHMGGGMGYSTIHPYFVRLLVEHVKKGGPKKVFVTDQSVREADRRGYTGETLGAELVASIGDDGKNVVKTETGWDKLPPMLIGKPILDADVLINFSHLKGHGDCGFGGACKNLAMGCVPGISRREMHSLEGSLAWNKEKCIKCNKCIRECEVKANKFSKSGDYEIFWHHCKMCLHCMLACPTGAIKIVRPKFDLFQEGLARVAMLVLKSFKRADVFHINMLTNITLFCDCWGLTTPSIVPDIGIFAGQDIVAVDDASLKAVKDDIILPGGIPPPFSLGKKGKHLFERIHRKDPFQQIHALERLGAGTTEYTVTEVK